MAKQRSYTLPERLQAALSYVITGSTVKASAICGIPDRTIREWTATEWWPDLILQAKKSKQEELDGILTGIIHLATDKAIERLQQGDPYVQKDQTVGYKPVGAKDATMVAAILMDKRALLRGEPTSRSAKVSESDRLNDIKEALSSSQKKEIASLDSSQAVSEAISEVDKGLH